MGVDHGARHEQGYIDHLKSSGFAVAVIDGVGVDNKTVARTREAMKGGAEIIVQGVPLQHLGRADRRSGRREDEGLQALNHSAGRTG